MKAVLALVTALAFVPLSQIRVDRRLESLGPPPDTRSVWTGPVVRAFSFGFRDVLADLYWLRAIQYYGREKIGGAADSYVDLLPLLDTAAELDPRYLIVYRYGAVFLSEAPPAGAGRPKDGVAFLAKGADRNPHQWQLRQDQGLFTALYLNDPNRASEILMRASEIPNAPPWMQSLAALVLTNGGELEGAIRLWQLLAEQAPPGPMRENAESQLMVARNRLLAKQVEQQVRAYKEKTGEGALSLNDLFARGAISTNVDLAGVPFQYLEETGRVIVSRSSPHWRR